MTRKKRRILGLILFFLSVLGYPSVVFAADFSHGLIIRVLDAPKETYYLEIMTRTSVNPAVADTPSLEYPRELTKPVSDLMQQGWVPFHPVGEPLHYEGILGEDYGDYREHRFYAPELKGDFLILIVSKETAKVTVSPVFSMTMAEQIVDYKKFSGTARPYNLPFGYFLMFLTILLPAAAIKLLLLANFKIPYRDNGKTVFLTSLLAALLTVAGSGQVLYHFGRPAAINAIILVLPVLILTEFLIYRKKLRNTTVRRILSYVLTTEIISMFLYFVTLVTSHRMFLAGF